MKSLFVYIIGHLLILADMLMFALTPELRQTIDFPFLFIGIYLLFVAYIADVLWDKDKYEKEDSPQLNKQGVRDISI